MGLLALIGGCCGFYLLWFWGTCWVVLSDVVGDLGGFPLAPFVCGLV